MTVTLDNVKCFAFLSYLTGRMTGLTGLVFYVLWPYVEHPLFAVLVGSLAGLVLTMTAGLRRTWHQLRFEAGEPKDRNSPALVSVLGKERPPVPFSPSAILDWGVGHPYPGPPGAAWGTGHGWSTNHSGPGLSGPGPSGPGPEIPRACV